MIQEFYIREADETDARGPYARSELEALIKRGEIKEKTLYYDGDAEEWRVFGANPELRRLLPGGMGSCLFRGLTGFSLLMLAVAILLPWGLSEFSASSDQSTCLSVRSFPWGAWLFLLAALPVSLWGKGSLCLSRMALLLGGGLAGISPFIQNSLLGASFCLAFAWLAILLAGFCRKQRFLMVLLLCLGLLGSSGSLILQLTQ